MQFTITYKEKEVTIDVTLWESTIDNRIEYYAVFADQQETFINFVKRTDQASVLEVSSSADLPEGIKTIIKQQLIYFIQDSDKQQ